MKSRMMSGRLEIGTAAAEIVTDRVVLTFTSRLVAAEIPVDTRTP